MKHTRKKDHYRGKNLEELLGGKDIFYDEHRKEQDPNSKYPKRKK